MYAQRQAKIMPHLIMVMPFEMGVLQIFSKIEKPSEWKGLLLWCATFFHSCIRCATRKHI